MILPQLLNLVKIDDDGTSESFGHIPDERPLSTLFEYGLILLDKPPGPTSHEVVSWVKKTLGLAKVGHSGTLDPGTTGLLPLGLGEATKALSVLTLGPKEYYALARVHSYISAKRIEPVMKEFTGDIYQRPPQRSAVRRATRIRTVYSFDLLEQHERLLLMRIVCQAGTYVRKIIYDLGEVLSSGATMIELRRTMVSGFSEGTERFARLHDILDAFESYKENKDETKLRELIKPIEHSLQSLRGVIVRDTAVDALCHGAQLAIPGIIAIPRDLRLGELVGIYTLKGEIVGLSEAVMMSKEIETKTNGFAFVMKRIIMKPNTYPKVWRSSVDSRKRVP
ncbi:MAG TPA: RNA-guided pseudouridylation complex pseudouridine synthase subunit Cbf5 [Nitrososphaeraceae archaeon]|nr:RNA-guided pseudouridylation complex pseudouridine synthase subunit Cbf5 [Nitrososphaeraceae archaeon]